MTTRSFRALESGIYGYICNTAIINGKKVTLTAKEQETILCEYYDEPVDIWHGEDWHIIAVPNTEEKGWEGRISLEEWGDYDDPELGEWHSGRQPRISKGVANHILATRQEVLAKANMLNDGRGFKVIQMPDWRGGHHFRIRNTDYELGDYEYVAWEGSPSKFAEEQPVFTEHAEPLHEKPFDYDVSALELISAAVERWT